MSGSLNGGSIRILWDADDSAEVTITNTTGAGVSFTVNGSAVTFPYTLSASTTFATEQSGRYEVSVTHHGIEIADTPDSTRFVNVRNGSQEVFAPSPDSGSSQGFLEDLNTALSATFARVVAATTLTDAGIAAAATEAGVGGAVYLLPGETYQVTSALTLDRVSVVGDGSPILNVAADLGVGVSAITVTSPVEGANNGMTIQGFRLTGPGARSLGVKTANCDGITVTGKAKPMFRDIRVTQFGAGIVWNNDSGHIYHQHIEVTDCYYGVYCKKNTYDYFVSDSRIDGNTFANFATPADQGFAAMVLSNVHMGFAPYAIYQEATPANQGKPKPFLQEVLLHHARMEAIGNAAILTDAQQDATNASLTSNLVIEHPGFSWNATYRIAARAKDYAVVLSQTERIIEIHVGANPFTAGDVGVYRVKQAGHDALILRGGSSQVATSQVTTDAGAANVFAFAAPLANGSSPSFAQVDVTASTGYYRWGDNNTRIGADGFQVLIDSTDGMKWRDSNNGYAERAQLNDTQFVVSAAHTIRTGRNVTASRPSASTAGAGAMFYDTTLGKPIWSDGTNWKDATGTAV